MIKATKPVYDEMMKMTDADEIFDLLIAGAYFAGQFGGTIPAEESRRVFQHIKKLVFPARKTNF